MTSTDEPSLAAMVNLDKDLVSTLARTYEGAAHVIHDPAEGAEHRRRDARPDTLIRWEMAEEERYAAWRAPAEAASILSASLLVASAAYWLLLQDADSARRCYANAMRSSGLAPDDRFVLSLCVGQPTIFADGPASEYVAALNQLATSAEYHDWNPEGNRPLLPTMTSPVLGIETQDLLALAKDLDALPPSDVRDKSARSRRARADAQFRNVLDRGARPIELARSDWRWPEQLGSLLPIEPELLSVGMLYVAWSKRQRRRLPRAQEGVAGLTVHAAQLLLGTSTGSDQP